jgi:hypothetical protein
MDAIALGQHAKDLINAVFHFDCRRILDHYDHRVSQPGIVPNGIVAVFENHAHDKELAGFGKDTVALFYDCIGKAFWRFFYIGTRPAQQQRDSCQHV